MGIVGYAGKSNQYQGQLNEAINTLLPGVHVEWFTAISNLKHHLLQKGPGKTVAVVFVSEEKELIELYFIQHLLRRVSLVLLLPNAECETIAMGHRLHPCFMCSSDIPSHSFLTALRSITGQGFVHQSLSPFPNPYESSPLPVSDSHLEDQRVIPAA